MLKSPPFSVIFLIIFLLLSVIVSFNFLNGFDFNALVKTQNILPDFLSTPFSIFSLLGSFEAITFFLLLFLLNFLKKGKIFVLIIYFFLNAAEVLGKILIDQTGPPVELLKTNLSIHFPSAYIPHEFFSYPSGHSARTAFLCFLIILFVLNSKTKAKNLIIIAVSLFGSIMFFSRVYLGEHWPSDVFGGVLLGGAFAFFASEFLKKRRFYSSHT